MPTIKGPIKFGSFNSKEFLEKNGVKVKLPFKATGFVATNIPKGADLSEIEFAKDEVKPFVAVPESDKVEENAVPEDQEEKPQVKKKRVATRRKKK